MRWIFEWLHIGRVVACLAPGYLLLIVGGLVIVGISESFSPPWDRHMLGGGALVAGLAFLGLMKRLLVSQFTLNAEPASHSGLKSAHGIAPDRPGASQIQDTGRRQQASGPLNQQPKSGSVPRRKQSALKADVQQLREEIEELKGLLHETILRINTMQPEHAGDSQQHVEGATGGESREVRDEMVASIERKLEISDSSPSSDDELIAYNYICSINDMYGYDLFSADSGISLVSDDPGISLIPAGSDLNLVPDDTDIELTSVDSDITLVPDDSDINLFPIESGISLDPADSGISLV